MKLGLEFFPKKTISNDTFTRLSAKFLSIYYLDKYDIKFTDNKVVAKIPMVDSSNLISPTNITISEIQIIHLTNPTKIHVKYIISKLYIFIQTFFILVGFILFSYNQLIIGLLIMLLPFLFGIPTLMGLNSDKKYFQKILINDTPTESQ